jgi:hypothetical protein
MPPRGSIGIGCRVACLILRAYAPIRERWILAIHDNGHRRHIGEAHLPVSLANAARSANHPFDEEAKG